MWGKWRGTNCQSIIHESLFPLKCEYQLWIDILGKEKVQFIVFLFCFFRKLTNILFLHLDRWSFKLLINRWNVICFCFHKRSPFPASFLYFRLYNSWQSILNDQFKKLANAWILTADLWWRKQPLWQLSQSHCPSTWFVKVDYFSRSVLNILTGNIRQNWQLKQRDQIKIAKCL